MAFYLEIALVGGGEKDIAVSDDVKINDIIVSEIDVSDRKPLGGLPEFATLDHNLVFVIEVIDFNQ